LHGGIAPIPISRDVARCLTLARVWLRSKDIVLGGRMAARREELIAIMAIACTLAA